MCVCVYVCVMDRKGRMDGWMDGENTVKSKEGGHLDCLSLSPFSVALSLCLLRMGEGLKGLWEQRGQDGKLHVTCIYAVACTALRTSSSILLLAHAMVLCTLQVSDKRDMDPLTLMCSKIIACLDHSLSLLSLHIHSTHSLTHSVPCYKLHCTIRCP